MENCKEYLGCNKKECIMFYKKTTRCWEEPDTLCNNPCFELLEKLPRKKCDYCMYYQMMHEKVKILERIR